VGAREGYETLLDTGMTQELQQLGRFIALAVEYKHKIGFEGQILMNPSQKSRRRISTISTQPQH